MSSINTPQATHPHTSALATRSLLSSASSEPTAPVLQRRPTNNYDEAVNAATQQRQQQPSATTGTTAAQSLPTETEGSTGDPTASPATAAKNPREESPASRPEFGRQPSWKLSDRRREGMERMLSSEKVGSGYGYSSQS